MATKTREKSRGKSKSQAAGTELRRVLHAELQRITAGPATAKSLGQAERFARIARECLMVAQGAEIRRSRRGQVWNSLNAVSVNPYLGDSDDDVDGESGVLAPSSGAENFASKSIREVVSGVTALVASLATPRQEAPSSFQIISAISEAKRQGLTELAATLESQMGQRFAVDPQPLALPAPSKKNGKNGKAVAP
jgi:hypothetical protein